MPASDKIVVMDKAQIALIGILGDLDNSDDRERLMHSGFEVYLARQVRDMFEAIKHLETDLSENRLALRGAGSDESFRRDWVIASAVYVV